jgi:hypothetical protein
MPTTFPPAAKAGEGEIMPAGGVQKDAAITTYDEVGDLAAQVVVDPSAAFTGGDFVAASKVERLEVERSKVAPQHYAGSRRIMTAHGIRDLYESGLQVGRAAVHASNLRYKVREADIIAVQLAAGS